MERIPKMLLRQARRAAGLTQEEVAEQLDVNPSTVGRWERGETEPYPNNIYELCQLLKKPAKELGLEPGDILKRKIAREGAHSFHHQETPLLPQEHPSTYFVQDRSNPHEIARLHVQDHLLTSNMGGVLAEQDNPERFQSILDVGCGTGGWLIEMAQKYPWITHLVGVDISRTMLDYAQAQARKAEVSTRIEFRVMDVLRMLEFADQSFDLVNQRLGMSYLRTWDWPKVLQEYRRVLRRNGIVRITEAAFVSSCSSPAYIHLNQCGVQAFHQAGHFFENTPDGVISHLAQLLRQYGYQSVQTRTHSTEIHKEKDPQWQFFYEDSQKGLQIVKPFLRKWGQLSDNYEETCYQALRDLRQPDFSVVTTLLTAWGVAP